jgi:hypothetical protein
MSCAQAAPNPHCAMLGAVFKVATFLARDIAWRVIKST